MPNILKRDVVAQLHICINPPPRAPKGTNALNVHKVCGFDDIQKEIAEVFTGERSKLFLEMLKMGGTLSISVHLVRHCELEVIYELQEGEAFKFVGPDMYVMHPDRRARRIWVDRHDRIHIDEVDLNG